jgi:hypothetical protein
MMKKCAFAKDIVAQWESTLLGRAEEVGSIPTEVRN